MPNYWPPRDNSTYFRSAIITKGRPFEAVLITLHLAATEAPARSRQHAHAVSLFEQIQVFLVLVLEIVILAILGFGLTFHTDRVVLQVVELGGVGVVTADAVELDLTTGGTRHRMGVVVTVL